MSDYGALKSQKDHKQEQKRSCERKIKEIDDKLRRLRSVKSVVGDVKGNVSDLTRRIKREYDDIGLWQGVEYRWGQSYTEGDLYGCYDRYKRELDRLQDQLCDEITRLENEKRKNQGLIASLVSAINSLINEMEKIFN